MDTSAQGTFFFVKFLPFLDKTCTFFIFKPFPYSKDDQDDYAFDTSTLKNYNEKVSSEVQANDDGMNHVILNFENNWESKP